MEKLKITQGGNSVAFALTKYHNCQIINKNTRKGRLQRYFFAGMHQADMKNCLKI